MDATKNETKPKVTLAANKTTNITNQTIYKNESRVVNTTINSTWSIQIGSSDGVTPDIGSALVIKLGNSKDFENGTILHIKIQYKTEAGSANAFSWLTTNQTLGKKLPYLFTQCQAIACRSFAPLQDTPAVKSTY